MGLRQTPRKPRPAGDYGNLGIKGRKTGVELRDTGIREADGMEPVPTFSSPNKLYIAPDDPTRENISHNATYTADDTMDIDQGSQSVFNERDVVAKPSSDTPPDVTDVIQSIKRPSATRLSIPRSASPIKGLMKGSPRKSLGHNIEPMSSPSRNYNNKTPIQLPVNRTLDFSSKSNTTPRLPRPNRSHLSSSARKSRKSGPFDLSLSSDEEMENETMQSSRSEPSAVYSEVLPQVDDEIEQENTMQSIEVNDDEIDAPIPLSDHYNHEDTTIPPSAFEEIPPDLTTTSRQSLSQSIPPHSARRSKPSAATTTEVYRDQDVDSESSSESRRSSKRRGAPSERDPNVPSKNRKTAERPYKRAASSVPPPTYTVARSETPATDGGAFTTRSGRVSFKPLASWRGEKAIYGQRTTRDSLPGLKEVVRTDEVVKPRRRVAVSVKPVKQRARSRTLESADEQEERHHERQDDDQDDALEQWETDTGIQYAMAMHWSHETNKYDEDNSEELEIAYAANAIEMRDIAGATFKFAKTLTLPFFGSGMVHLPPKGEKRVKNSRKMQMVFFVHYGRVSVHVGTPTTSFSIGIGGMWHVPRGNFYSIVNESETRDARLFFAQGCQWSGELEEGNTVTE